MSDEQDLETGKWPVPASESVGDTVELPPPGLVPLEEVVHTVQQLAYEDGVPAADLPGFTPDLPPAVEEPDYLKNDGAEPLKEPPRMDEEELTGWVEDLVHGRVFTALHVPEGESLGMVFMPLGLMGFAGWDIEKIGMVMERLENAGPRSCNGLPMFMSLRLVHVDDWKVIAERHDKVRAAMDEAMKQ